MTKDKNINGVSQKEYDHATLLLKEAEKNDLHWEVKQYAHRYIQEGYGLLNHFSWPLKIGLSES